MKRFLIFIISVGLAACGGGGGEGISTASPTVSASFPLQKAFENLYKNGYQKTLSSVTSTVYTPYGTNYTGGEISVSRLPSPGGTTLAGQFALSSNYSVTGTLKVNSSYWTVDEDIGQDFISGNFSHIADVSPNYYCTAISSEPIPEKVSVGHTATLANYSCFTDSNMKIDAGNKSVGLSVFPGPSETNAFLVLTANQTKIRYFGGNVTRTSYSNRTTKYIVDTVGKIDLVSVSYRGILSQRDLSVDFYAE